MQIELRVLRNSTSGEGYSYTLLINNSQKTQEHLPVIKNLELSKYPPSRLNLLIFTIVKQKKILPTFQKAQTRNLD